MNISVAMLTANTSLVCFNMFYDEALRVPQHGQSATELSETLYNHTIPNDDLWRKIGLHTPPYSTDQNWKRQSVIVPQPSPTGLQVVPDDWAAEDLSSDLPLVLSDAELERLTSSTFGNDLPWQVGEVGEFDQSLENQHLQVSGSNLLACTPVRRVEMKAIPPPHQEPLRDLQSSFGSGLTGLESQDAALGQRAAARWTPYPVPYNQQILQRRSSDELVVRPTESAGKRSRKSRRPSRSSPQRLDSTESEEPEENETGRATHNVLERQRREDLKYRFQVLRDSIPDIVDNERAPKVMILKKAKECVLQLDREKERLLADKELERQRRFILLERLHTLRQNYQSYQML